MAAGGNTSFGCVLRHDVSRADSPCNLKRIIQADYSSDPAQVRAVFLFGHIPVAYSGNLNPDGHPNHQGAWPTDAYYGDMDGSWTDVAQVTRPGPVLDWMDTQSRAARRRFYRAVPVTQ